ncbi:hypothetical protein NQ113_24940 [Bacillus pseudomycoides]|uniref:hypothetical protein n=1 Tax=Bacillus pseudomycoides TaxID=64104 RepID=UPI00215A20B5|nr:hypothetical protein [Bacillus pseudomycoides]MCR8860422.1 hypothetical protein [Bacillus pseudomycoides]
MNYNELIKHYGLDGEGNTYKEFKTKDIRKILDNLMSLLHTVNMKDTTDNYKTEKLTLILKGLRSIDDKL